jgi:hypothetical protein
MPWLTWRQHRWALIGSLALTALLVSWLLCVSHDMTTLYNQCRETHCSKNTPKGSVLWAGNGPILQAEILVLIVQYTPLLIGVFVGVPVLSREYEQRTLLLAWSQDVSPMRDSFSCAGAPELTPWFGASAVVSDGAAAAASRRRGRRFRGRRC